MRAVNSKTSPEDFGGGTGAASSASSDMSPGASTLSASSVTADTATLTIGNWPADWYYKQSSPTTGQCSSAQTSATADLTGLATGTSLTFKAYSDSGCTTELATSAAFLTKPGQVSNVAADARDSGLAVSWGRRNRRGELQDPVEVRQPELGLDQPANDLDHRVEEADEPHQWHPVHGPGSRDQHDRRRCLVKHHYRHSSRRNAHSHQHHRQRRNTQYRKLRRHLVLQVHLAERRTVLLSPNPDYGKPHAELEHDVHVQGVQQ